MIGSAGRPSLFGHPLPPGPVEETRPCKMYGLCPVQDDLIKVTPDDALEGTCWEGQPYHVTLGRASADTTAENLTAAGSGILSDRNLAARFLMLMPRRVFSKACHQLVEGRVLDFAFQKMSKAGHHAVQKAQTKKHKSRRTCCQ